MKERNEKGEIRQILREERWCSYTDFKKIYFMAKRNIRGKTSNYIAIKKNNSVGRQNNISTVCSQ